MLPTVPLWRLYDLLAGLSCSRHGVVAAWLTSERPGNVMSVLKGIYCLGKYTRTFSHCRCFWKRQTPWRRMRAASSVLYSLVCRDLVAAVRCRQSRILLFRRYVKYFTHCKNVSNKFAADCTGMSQAMPLKGDTSAVECSDMQTGKCLLTFR